MKIDLLTTSKRLKLESWNLDSNRIFLYTRCIMPKRVTSWQGPSPHRCSRAHSSFRIIVAAVASRWQHCVRFDRPEIWTPDLPLQRLKRYRSTNWSVNFGLNIKIVERVMRADFGNLWSCDRELRRKKKHKKRRFWRQKFINLLIIQKSLDEQS